jgi:hypothetical protein
MRQFKPYLSEASNFLPEGFFGGQVMEESTLSVKIDREMRSFSTEKPFVVDWQMEIIEFNITTKGNLH